ncbi:hypothetical protein [Kordia jejudonensis]|uniref:hypothetical protein n=1 Tax=Kordia jejudonensis TaxID=1348245 RepID=UPI000629BF19|nr:hypothetical protein [Kordia jejudonensis]
MSAQQITITFKAEGATAYTANVTNLSAGNMVDPSSGVSWSTQPDGQNPYVWYNDGQNANKFGLMANYTYNGEVATAFSQLVIDPTKISGNVAIEAELCTAAIDGDEGNTILRFKSATVNGEANEAVASVSDWGSDKPQPPSEFYN